MPYDNKVPLASNLSPFEPLWQPSQILMGCLFTRLNYLYTLEDLLAQYGEICQGHTVIFLGQLEIQFPLLTIDSMEQAQRYGALKCSTLIDCPNEAKKKKKKKRGSQDESN